MTGMMLYILKLMFAVVQVMLGKCSERVFAIPNISKTIMTVKLEFGPS